MPSKSENPNRLVGAILISGQDMFCGPSRFPSVFQSVMAPLKDAKAPGATEQKVSICA